MCGGPSASVGCATKICGEGHHRSVLVQSISERSASVKFVKDHATTAHR
jgi:hypothetical protein